MRSKCQLLNENHFNLTARKSTTQEGEGGLRRHKYSLSDLIAGHITCYMSLFSVVYASQREESCLNGIAEQNC